MGSDLLWVSRANDARIELEKALTALFFRKDLSPHMYQES